MLEQYDYDTRCYDRVIEKWYVVHPSSEPMRRHSPTKHACNYVIRCIIGQQTVAQLPLSSLSVCREIIIYIGPFT